MQYKLDIERIMAERNRTGYGQESIKEEVRARMAMEAFIKECQLTCPEEVAELFESYTRVIWQYQCPGEIYRFYNDETICHGSGGSLVVGADAILASTIKFMRSFPDRRVDFVDIFVEGNEEEGYSFGQSTRFIAANKGWSQYGPPTGKSLSTEEDGYCYSICELRLEKREGRWRVVEEWVVDSEEVFAATMQMSDDDSQKEESQGKLGQEGLMQEKSTDWI